MSGTPPLIGPCRWLSWYLPLAAGLCGPLTGSSVCGADEGAALETAFRQHVAPFLQQHCVRCHNAEELTSGVRVDHLDAAFEDRQLKLWQAIRRHVDERSMPPADEPQPSDSERQQLSRWVEQGLQLARQRPVPRNGSVRRLTVAQYRNTLRELLLLEDELTDILPPDAVSREGFVNNQETLALSPLLLETWLQIAEQALERTIVDVSVPPTIQNFRVELGAGINAEPCPDKLILGADSLLLDNRDVVVRELTPAKPFEFTPFRMRTRYRFIEGYQGNDTVRGWRDFDSIYHAVFACMRGTHGYPKGRAYSTVPEGLLLRPAIPSAELFGVDSTYGPQANFKISLRELPDHGRFRVTVTAARYSDGLLLDAGAAPQSGAARQSGAATDAVTCRGAGAAANSVTLPEAGIYQVDVYTEVGDSSEAQSETVRPPAKNQELTLQLADRWFQGTLQQPAFLVVRLPAGELSLQARFTDAVPQYRIVLTRLSPEHEVARQFAAFEQRSPLLGVHLGLRRDCGSTLNAVGRAYPVSTQEFRPYVFEGAIRNFPSPDVEPDNVNYLAGIREIGVRSEFTDGRDVPRLLIRAVEFEGPLYDEWPPTPYRRIFGDAAAAAETSDRGQQIIRDFATRAFRRPITPAEEARLCGVFDDAVSQDRSFQEGVRDALQAVLTSPQFLFLIEQSSSPEPEPLDQFELASKLSYFLWNGPPDATTLSLAGSGRLYEQLDAEVSRLIGDPRFARFVHEFATQWLALDKFAVLEPDREQFPQLTRDTRAQLSQEPVQFLLYLLRQNLPVRQLIDSDVVVANDVVAAYYNLAERPNSGLEFVPVAHHREDLGGVLTQAAILAGLSDGREANPVKRGAWLARRIIAEPPDDPPPNVPALAEDTRQLSLRERLERHRSQPGCAECHTRIDPWGIPFEQFDAGGRWKPQPVDGHSVLPDQTQVNSFPELQRYLADERIDQVAFSVLQHLAIYAAGRSLTWNELELLRQQGLQLQSTDYRMQDLIRWIVHSPIFLEK